MSCAYYYYMWTPRQYHSLLKSYNIPIVLFDISYIVFTVSLLEFIIAQPLHTMEGILIGFYYVFRYGVAGLPALVQLLPCTYLHSDISCRGTVSYIVITIIAHALLSFIMFSIVTCKYKLRERDEVVSVHIFAKEYYGTREDDSSKDYSVDAWLEPRYTEPELWHCMTHTSVHV